MCLEALRLYLRIAQRELMEQEGGHLVEACDGLVGADVGSALKLGLWAVVPSAASCTSRRMAGRPGCPSPVALTAGILNMCTPCLSFYPCMGSGVPWLWHPQLPPATWPQVLAAFTRPQAAIRWSLNVIQACLEADWPGALLLHELGRFRSAYCAWAWMDGPSACPVSHGPILYMAH